ncbi:DUF4214 domain-containing protein [Sulfitobacter sp. S190]|uniref:DUF4214 domain-containing protein n=1 Tax=Sulfitobacter sp. S190 TaxID=2867022 RepID=UPI0021A64B6D|nr:DUF4214 domain-containing protein [Sulfitobacter sp. S190]UWR21232.1 DUF4214 domain-containing protein [Sulfitobacter sp. S190]
MPTAVFSNGSPITFGTGYRWWTFDPRGEENGAIATNVRFAMNVRAADGGQVDLGKVELYIGSPSYVAPGGNPGVRDVIFDAPDLPDLFGVQADTAFDQDNENDHDIFFNASGFASQSLFAFDGEAVNGRWRFYVDNRTGEDLVVENLQVFVENRVPTIPDLVVKDITIEGPLTPNSEAEFIVDITNIGDRNYNIGQPTQIQYFVDGRRLDETDSLLLGLGAGQTDAESVTFRIGDTVPERFEARIVNTNGGELTGNNRRVEIIDADRHSVGPVKTLANSGEEVKTAILFAHSVYGDGKLANVALRNNGADNGRDDDYRAFFDSLGWQVLTDQQLGDHYVPTGGTRVQSDNRYAAQAVFQAGGLYEGSVDLLVVDDKYEAQALLAQRTLADGSKELVLTFRGTDGEDTVRAATGQAWSELGQEKHYESLRPIIEAAISYANDNGNDVSKFIVAGHSLGAAMVDIFTAVHGQQVKSSIDLTAVAVASPGMAPQLLTGLNTVGTNWFAGQVDTDVLNDLVGRPGVDGPRAPDYYIGLGHSQDPVPYPFSGNVTLVTVPLLDNQNYQRFLPIDLATVDGQATQTGFGPEHASGRYQTVINSIVEDPLYRFYSNQSLIVGNYGSGTSGDDRYFPATDESPEIRNTLFGTAQRDFVLGIDGNDAISGLDGDDLLSGGSGQDTIRGDRGDDRISGGPENDDLSGGGGNDRLWGDDGKDRLRGDIGNDVLHSGRGADALDGGSGNDLLTGGDFERDLNLVGYEVSLALLNQGDAGRQYLVIENYDAMPTTTATFEFILRGDEATQSGSVSYWMSYAVPGTDNEILVQGDEGSIIAILVNGTRIETDILTRDVLDGNAARLTLTLDGTDGVNRLQVYVNGDLAFETREPAAVTPLQAGGTLVFGADQDDVGGGFVDDQIFRGAIGDIRVWNVVRSAEEIAAFAFDAIPDAAADPSLVSNWQGGAANESTPFTDTQGNGALNLTAWENGSAPVFGAFGGAIGADTLIGGVGRDTLQGGVGEDLLVGDRIVEASDGFEAQLFRIYQATLNRLPDTGGFDVWTDLLETGARDALQVISGFTGSPEFLQTYGNLEDRAFVELLYQNVLGRDADATGLEGWLDMLADGAARSAVVRGFSESPEFREQTRELANLYAEARDQGSFVDDVYRLYQATLDRNPDDAGLDDWTRQLANNAAIEDIASGFVQSTEFQNNYGALNNEAFVELLYRNVLDREPDDTGFNAWLDLLEAGNSRESVVLGFSQSPEFTRTTTPSLREFMQQSPGDTFEGGANDDILAGSYRADTFVFDADHKGRDIVLQFDMWDTAEFRDFGYDSGSDVLAQMRLSGEDVVFSDQGVTVVFSGWNLSAMSEIDFLV